MGSDRIVDWARDHRTEPRLGTRESMAKRKATMVELGSDRAKEGGIRSTEGKRKGSEWKREEKWIGSKTRNPIRTDGARVHRPDPPESTRTESKYYEGT